MKEFRAYDVYKYYGEDFDRPLMLQPADENATYDELVTLFRAAMEGIFEVNKELALEYDEEYVVPADVEVFSMWEKIGGIMNTDIAC